MKLNQELENCQMKLKKVSSDIKKIKKELKQQGYHKVDTTLSDSYNDPNGFRVIGGNAWYVGSTKLKTLPTIIKKYERMLFYRKSISDKINEISEGIYEAQLEEQDYVPSDSEKEYDNMRKKYINFHIEFIKKLKKIYSIKFTFPYIFPENREGLEFANFLCRAGVKNLQSIHNIDYYHYEKIKPIIDKIQKSQYMDYIDIILELDKQHNLSDTYCISEEDIQKGKKDDITRINGYRSSKSGKIAFFKTDIKKTGIYKGRDIGKVILLEKNII